MGIIAWIVIGLIAGALGKLITADIKTIERGGIIGSVEIVDCVSVSNSRWYMGEWGFVLRDPQPLPFTPWKGQLSFFDVPESSLNKVASAILSQPS